MLLQHWYRYWYYLIFRRYLRVECIIKCHTYYLIIMTSIVSHIWCLYTATFMHCLFMYAICIWYGYTPTNVPCIFNSGLSIPLFWMNKPSQKASVYRQKKHGTMNEIKSCVTLKEVPEEQSFHDFGISLLPFCKQIWYVGIIVWVVLRWYTIPTTLELLQRGSHWQTQAP